MTVQLMLPLDYSEADDYIVKQMATEAIADEHFTHWDHAYESLWEWFETELHYYWGKFDISEKEYFNNA